MNSAIKLDAAFLGVVSFLFFFLVAGVTGM